MSKRISITKYVFTALVTLGMFCFANFANAAWYDIFTGYNESPNPFEDWEGVDNRYPIDETLTNPFADWTGVDNSCYYSYGCGYSPNPFGGWTGVNNGNQSSNTSNNPFAGWTGVNNSNQSANTASNPFNGWTGVNNANNTSNVNASNPFTGWTGVNNSTITNSTTEYNPFSDWSGVNNSPQVSNQEYNPFSDWKGVPNSRINTEYNPFSDWTGVNNSTQNSNTSVNPFGDWTGVNNGSSYNSSGYSVTQADTQVVTESPRANLAQATTSTQTSTNYVAPKTGVDKWAPFVFALLLTLGYFTFRNRKWIFN